MVPKKSSKADLESKKSLFFEIGLALAMLLVLMAFEWKSTQNIDVKILSSSTLQPEFDLLPTPVNPEKDKPAPPKEISYSDQITVIENYLEPKGEVDIFPEIGLDDPVPVFKIKPDETEIEDPFISVEIMPKFGNGDIEEFRKDFVLKNLKYPQDAQENGVWGWVYIEFVVECDGSVSNVNSVRNTDQSLINEAIRVIKMSPKWTPGKHNGKPARVKFVLPINFVLN